MHPLVGHHDVTPLSRLENLADLLIEAWRKKKNIEEGVKQSETKKKE